MPTTALEKVISDELKSGLKITLVDEGGELYARVSWIYWDSGFRDSGLEVEDRIIAINGAPLTLPEDPKERRIARDRVIGGLSESKLFAELGCKDASPLTLTVLRRQLPGRGWTRLEVTGGVRAERFYYTTDGKPAVAPGGPERLGRNDAGDTWMSWLERREVEWSNILDGRWLGKFNSRVELANHLELKPRIDHALESRRVLKAFGRGLEARSGIAARPKGGAAHRCARLSRTQRPSRKGNRRGGRYGLDRLPRREGCGGCLAEARSRARRSRAGRR
jgi:hypothetical protein